MSILFNKTIIHNLDIGYGKPILSKECIDLTDSTEKFITRNLIKVTENQAACEASFKNQPSLVPDDEPYEIIRNWDNEKFLHFTEILANKFYRYMIAYGNIENGDLFVTNYTVDGNRHVAALKINFKKDVHTHLYNQHDGVMKLIENKSTYEPKITEAVLINIENGSVTLLDETKSKYIGIMLDLETKLSVKEKLKVLDTVTSAVIDEHYDNRLQALSDLKSNITESLAKTNSINIAEVIEKTFGQDEEVLQSCKEHLEEVGLNEENSIEVTGSKLFSKYANQKLKTDTCIEIKMPTQIFKNTDFFEIVNESDGTMTLKIKNVSQVINK